MTATMHCHICNEPAIGQCQSCWKFYCASHGDMTCEKCAQRPAGDGAVFSWTRPVRQGAGFGVTTLQAPQGGEPRVRPELPPGFFRGEVLRGVLAVAEMRHTGAADLTLVSLESYEDGFSVFWRLRSTTPHPEPASPFAVAHPRLVFAPVHDDSGAKYEGGIGGGGGGSAELWRGEARFTPAIADAAQRLDVRIEEIQWGSSAANVRSRAEVGPWTFEISLSDLRPAS